MSGELKLTSVRPLVRYVDKDQAVIDTYFQTLGSIPDADVGFTGEADVHITIQGLDGFHDEGQTRTPVKDGRGSVRFEMVQPDRWWPAGMGEQPLYELTLRLVQDGHVTDQHTAMIGLTSVRREKQSHEMDQPGFLVNGQHCPIQSVVMVDKVDENHLLPATGDSLLLVRDHYGPELLYEAADRAGVLLIQSVPISEKARPGDEVCSQINRLASHPCLAGWFVGHLGDARNTVTKRIKALDPTHAVFEDFPSPGLS
jgi:Glycosyl hydrolases family 2